MNAVCYCRCSTAEQTESGLGLEAQRHAMEQHCARNGWQLVGMFVDAGISGGAPLDKRHSLMDAVNAVTRGSVLLVMKRDRLARDVMACALVERMVQKRGGRVVSVAGEGTDDDDPTSVLLRRVVDAFSEYERLVIAARTRAALQAKRRRGERAGRVPFGYQLAGEGAVSRAGIPVQLRAVPAQLEVVERIHAERAAGTSVRAIAAGLTRDGIPTATGSSTWTYSSVQRVCQRATGTTSTVVLSMAAVPAVSQSTDAVA